MTKLLEHGTDPLIKINISEKDIGPPIYALLVDQLHNEYSIRSNRGSAAGGRMPQCCASPENCKCSDLKAMRAEEEQDIVKLLILWMRRWNQRAWRPARRCRRPRL